MQFYSAASIQAQTQSTTRRGIMAKLFTLFCVCFFFFQSVNVRLGGLAVAVWLAGEKKEPVQNAEKHV